jgi:hypothetical protein
MKLVYKIQCWENWRTLRYWRKFKNSFVLYRIKHEHKEHSTTCSSCLWNQQGAKYNQRTGCLKANIWKHYMWRFMWWQEGTEKPGHSNTEICCHYLIRHCLVHQGNLWGRSLEW